MYKIEDNCTVLICGVCYFLIVIRFSAWGGFPAQVSSAPVPATRGRTHMISHRFPGFWLYFLVIAFEIANSISHVPPRGLVKWRDLGSLKIELIFYSSGGILTCVALQINFWPDVEGLPGEFSYNWGHSVVITIATSSTCQNMKLCRTWVGGGGGVIYLRDYQDCNHKFTNSFVI